MFFSDIYLHLDGDRMASVNRVIKEKSNFNINSYRKTADEIIHKRGPVLQYEIGETIALLGTINEKWRYMEMAGNINMLGVFRRVLNTESNDNVFDVISDYVLTHSFAELVPKLQLYYGGKTFLSRFSMKINFNSQDKFESTTKDMTISASYVFEFELNGHIIKGLWAEGVDVSLEEIQSFNYVEIQLEEVTQIRELLEGGPDYERNNLPSNLRRVVLSNYPQYVCPPALRRPQSAYTWQILEFLQQLRRQYGNVSLDVTIQTQLTTSAVAVIRIVLQQELTRSLFLVNVPKDTPMYMTCRVPSQLLLISEIVPVRSGGPLSQTEVDEFESNVTPNAMIGAAVIGGGLLSGLGQGLGSWGSAKLGQETKQMEINWLRERNNQDWQQRNLMQGDMFQHQLRIQQGAFGQDREMQARMFEQQYGMQNKAFKQQIQMQQQAQAYGGSQNLLDRQHQLAMQQNQINLTRDLVQLTSDADMRRASYAQNLAGFRTGGAVANLSYAGGRGGVGHPNAPTSNYHPPRTLGTQTESPTVFMTHPTRSVEGPSSSNY